MRVVTNVASPMILALSLLGCTSMMASPAPLQGDWALREIRGSQPLTLADTGTPFTLSLEDGNRAGGKVACNGWHGQAQQQGSTLQIQAAGSTRMRCVIKDAAIRSFEKRYLATLQTPATHTVVGDQLQLQFGNGETWIFQRQHP